MSEFNKLLLIDDEPDILRVLSMSLRADGYDVVTAENGSAGLTAFEKEYYLDHDLDLRGGLLVAQFYKLLETHLKN